MEMYKSALFTVKLKLNEEGTACVPDVDFKVYGENYVLDGKPINLSNVKLAGTEVLAKLDYRVEPHRDPLVLVEKEKAEKHNGYMGNDFAVIQKDVRYTSKYPITKETALATYTDLGIKVVYDGIDKDEPVKFCQWSEPVKEVKEI